MSHLHTRVMECCTLAMIQGTRGKLAANALSGEYGKGFPDDLVKVAKAMCTALNAVVQVEELRFSPRVPLKVRKGDRARQHSVRINDQWPTGLVWTSNGPADVEDCRLPLKGTAHVPA